MSKSRITSTTEKWERKDGVKFLKRIRVRAGQTVLDFGAGVGHYSIPAALVVGTSGVVYALDKERQELDELRQKVRRLKLKNVEIIRTKGLVKLDFRDESIDVVLFYDVLHYLRKFEREDLYRETHRILKTHGFVSVYPKHVIDDSPLAEFRHLHQDDVKQEIQNMNFTLQEEYCDTISHNDFRSRGCVLNFIKG